MPVAFISYSHKDSAVLERLHTHMALLKKEGSITTWSDNEILAGGNIDDGVNSALKNSDIFIAIVSPNYLASNYCYENEFKEALKMLSHNEILIIPVIAEHCDWKSSPFGKLKALPKDGKPISDWNNPNYAYQNITDELRRFLEKPKPNIQSSGAKNTASKSYKVKRDFDAVDKLNFRDESFTVIYNYFLESIDEVNGLDNIKARIIEKNDRSFSAVITNRAKINTTGFITVVLQSDNAGYGRGELAYSMSEKINTNSMDRNFSIAQTDYDLYWSARDIFHSAEKQEVKTAKDIAEKLWKEFVEQVGVSF